MKKGRDWTVIDSEREREILEERAKELSQAADGRDLDTEEFDVLEFKLSGSRMAVESGFVEAVQTLKELTPLPGAPDNVFGIGYLRGRVVCIHNLSRMLDMPSKGLNERDSIILLAKQGMEFAVVVEEIIGYRSLDKKHMYQAVSQKNTELNYVMGVGDDGLLLLDAAELFDDQSLVVDQG